MFSVPVLKRACRTYPQNAVELLDGFSKGGARVLLYSAARSMPVPARHARNNSPRKVSVQLDLDGDRSIVMSSC